MSSKRLRRRSIRRRNDDLMFDVRLDLLGGGITMSSGRATLKCRLHYLELHRLIPEDLTSWPEERLRALIDTARMTERQDDWERALILLAHHRSKLAVELLKETERRVPEKLADFWEIAYGESLGWLGLDYVHDANGEPTTLPAGMPWPSGPVN